MSQVEFIAATEHKLRGLLGSVLPNKTFVKLYSNGRLSFLSRFAKESPRPIQVAEELSQTLWGIRFRSPIFNAAGMLKNGDAYHTMYAQGAGAYLAGTTTANARTGNKKDGIYCPFSPYPRSGAASNWLGLPNDSDEVVAKRLKELPRYEGFPIGVSVMGSPDYEGEEKLAHLLHGMKAYEDAGVDFIEINESCPNTEHGTPQSDGLAERLNYLKTEFLLKRTRNLPVIVKFSNDTEVSQVPDLLDLLTESGFDGVNFGNTSVAYELRKEKIDSREHGVYDYYTSTFGGGVSGLPLKEASLSLAKAAADHLKKKPASQEFHVIRTGGISSAEDVNLSLKSGISLTQWYTAYFERFGADGHKLYKVLYDSLEL